MKSILCHLGESRLLPFVLLGLGLASVLPARADDQKHNPTSKLFVAEVKGQSDLNNGEKIHQLTNSSVFSAQGTVISTDAKSTNAMVFSNGSGICFAPDTTLHVNKFVQEPFTPHRTDMNVEPSISNTRTFLSTGTVGLCNSQLVAGSRMVYTTPQTAVNVRGRKLAIEVSAKGTTVSAIEGDCTLRNPGQDAGGDLLRPGQQAFIPADGGPIQIQPIPPAQRGQLDSLTSQACAARKKVYFEERKTDVQGNEVTGFSPPVSTDKSEKGETQEIVAVLTTPATPPVTPVSVNSLPKS